MEEVLVELVTLRERIQQNQVAVKAERERLKGLTEQVQQYMESNNIRTITNVAGNHTVSLVVSQRLPSLTLDFVQRCLLCYLQQAGQGANANDAASWVFEQRKQQRQVVSRVQVRQMGSSRQPLPTILEESKEEDEEEEEEDTRRMEFQL